MKKKHSTFIEQPIFRFQVSFYAILNKKNMMLILRETFFMQDAFEYLKTKQKIYKVRYKNVNLKTFLKISRPFTTPPGGSGSLLL